MMSQVTLLYITGDEVMPTITQTINGKKLSKLIHIPSSMKDKELEITIRPVRRKSLNMGRLYSNPIKVDTLVIPTREERNAR